MADAQLLNNINSGGEVSESIVLDTLMYSNVFEREGFQRDYITNGMELETIVEDLLQKSDSLKADEKEALQHVNEYLKAHPESDVGKMKIATASDQMGGDYNGAKACTFYKTDQDGKVTDVVVAFRGTGSGRWYDNGDAFDKQYSPYQQQAAKYYDETMRMMQDKYGVDDSCNVVATGHSKGGNMAQFITLGSSYAYMIDNVYSFDGQGFSPEAIEYFKELYGEDFYNEQCKKMYSICGDNDFVNVLGNKVIPEENTVYIETPTEVTDAENAHALYDSEKGNLFDFITGEFRETTEDQRELAAFARVLSEAMMKLPPEEREDVCRSIMSFAEFGIGKRKTGLNGEIMSYEELVGLIKRLGYISNTLVDTEEGQAIVREFIIKTIKDISKNDSSLTGKIILLIILAYSYKKTPGSFSLVQWIANTISEVMKFTERVYERVKVAFDFCKNVIEGLKHNLKMFFNKSYRNAQTYLAESSHIRVNTDALRDLAWRIDSVNSRLHTIDTRIDGLYRKTKLTDLWSLMHADLGISWSKKLARCVDYLDETAERFDNAEREILRLLG